MNWLFGAAGAVAFYLAVRRIASEGVARVSSIVYATIFFAWFSANVQTTYASQLFFPVAVFLCLVRYWEDSRFSWLVAAGGLFALGSGFRPSDGVFFAPAFLYGLSRGRIKHVLGCVAVVFSICVAWLIPQRLALSRVVNPIASGGRSHFAQIADGILVSGFSLYALANVVRCVLPLILALMPLSTLIFGNRRQNFLWLWILPGTIFYLLIYFSEPPYLDYLLAAFVLLAATNPTASDKKKIRLLLACAALNLVFYFGWRPIEFRNPRLHTAESVVDAYLGKCTFYAVQHHYDPRLSDLLGIRGWGQ